MKERHLFYGVMLVSMAMLALETLLPRIFAVYVGPNFVYFSISIALVGLSSGGIIVYVWEKRFLQQPSKKLVNLSLFFAISIIAVIWMVYFSGSLLNSTIDNIYATILNSEEAQKGYVLSQSIVVPSMAFVLISGLLWAIPFMFAGLCISLAFLIFSKNFGKIYAYDLIGAGLGCTFTVVSLTWLSATTAFIVVSLLAAIGALFFMGLEVQKDRIRWAVSWAATIVLLALALFSIFGSPPFQFQIHKYAFLRSYHNTPLTELKHKWTPLGRIALCNREWSPPLNSEPKMRPLTFVGMDLGGFSVVETYSKDNLAIIKNTSVFSDDIMEPIVVPGMYLQLKDYLVLMAGNGQDMLRAYAWYGDEINLDGVELNPVVYELGLKYEKANLHAFFDNPNVHMNIDEGRAFVEKSQKKYDLICLSYSGATFATGTGSLASTPQFLFTQEAYLTYLDKLNPGGVLVIIGSALPDELPRSTKTFISALKKFNPNTDLRRHILCYSRPGVRENLNYTIYHRDPLTHEQIMKIKETFNLHNLEITYSAFTESNYPAMEDFFDRIDSESNVSKSMFSHSSLGQDRIHTDNHPFYYFDLVWGWIGGYLVIGYLTTFFSALLVAGLFLLIPLLLKKGGTRVKRSPPWFFYLAFAMIGTGFMLIEVGSLQKFELFLGNPTLTLVVILAALLIFTGIGSLFSNRLFDNNILTFPRTAFGILLYGMFVLLFLNRLIYGMMGLSLGLKIIIIAIILFPLGFLLGNLFPQLLRLLEMNYKRFIPWALAINGVFSVASSNLGAIIYLFLGANAVVVSGLLCYTMLGIAAFIFVRKNQDKVEETAFVKSA